ncbi:hypothetical protein WA026_014278 [Henosepilachna vigintioctopunctata]|uniref:Uncharacterized protein n=1 Tax=Henosepilachna vigintioctopunctata TaxID=420089 RepID=A0AAW1TU20_9CUCU
MMKNEIKILKNRISDIQQSVQFLSDSYDDLKMENKNLGQLLRRGAYLRIENIFIIGDININIDADSNLASEYLNVMAEFNFSSLINGTTRVQGNSQSSIDHIFHNNDNITNENCTSQIGEKLASNLRPPKKSTKDSTINKESSLKKSFFIKPVTETEIETTIHNREGWHTS